MIRKNENNKECLAFLKQKWRENLSIRFNYFLDISDEANEHTNKIFDASIQTLEDIFLSFSGLKDDHFNTEIMSPNKGCYEHRLAEMLFYDRLRRMGFENIRSNNDGPDFYASKKNTNFCFEVVTPTPNKKISDLINSNNITREEIDILFSEKLLSVTSVIRKKLDDYERFKSKKTVSEEDVYIVVINDSLLLPCSRPWYGAINEVCFGRSSLPVVADATLGLGEFDAFLYPHSGKINTDESDNLFRPVITQSNMSISVNGSEAIPVGEGAINIPVRHEILTRAKTNAIAVNIADSTGIAGFYQITLREDLFFLMVLPCLKYISPKSALISSAQKGALLKDLIFYSSFYSSEGEIIQPIISPAYILGRDLDEFNNQAMYKNLYKPILKTGSGE